MNEVFQDSLSVLKTAFIGSETKEVADRIGDHFQAGQIRLLDVGIGRGETTKKIITRMATRGIQTTVVGVDVHRSSSLVMIHDPQFTFIKTEFERFSSEQMFDIVISTHSLYYLGTPTKVLEKMIGFLKPSGLLVLSLMSRECLLYHLNRTVFGTESAPVCAEEVRDLFLGFDTVESVNLSLYRGDVDLLHIQADQKLLQAAAYLVSRRKTHLLTSEEVRALGYALSLLPTHAKRVVGTLFAIRQ